MLIKDYYSGNCFNAYEYFGAHKANVKNQSGYTFRVFAPNAVSVNVTGEFNNWQETAMQKNSDGIYEVFIPNVPDGQMYQYLISNRDGTCVRKTDPYGFQMEKRPGISSKTCDFNFKFTDENWMNNRDLNYTRPLKIYEMHFGSWKQKSAEGDKKFFSYKEISSLIIPYLKEHNFTHLEL
jgi:1,4-alpha-glucan branching enzyme